MSDAAITLGHAHTMIADQLTAVRAMLLRHEAAMIDKLGHLEGAAIREAQLMDLAQQIVGDLAQLAVNLAEIAPSEALMPAEDVVRNLNLAQVRDQLNPVYPERSPAALAELRKPEFF